MAQCQSDYDEEKDGDYNAYVQKRLDSEMGSMSMSDSLSGLEGQKASASERVSSLRAYLSASVSKISSLQSSIADNSNNISDYKSAISKNEARISGYEAKIANLNNKVSDQRTIIENANVLIAYSNETVENNSARMEEIEKENPQKNAEMKSIVSENMTEEDFEMFSTSSIIDFSANNSEGLSALKTLAQKENLINNNDDNVLDEKDMAMLSSKYNLFSKENVKEKVAETNAFEFFA